MECLFVCPVCNKIELITMTENVEEAEDDNNAAHVEDQHRQCPISNAGAMIRFDKCLIWLWFQPEASLENTSTLI